MKQSEELMQGVQFTPFLVDLEGFNSYKGKLMADHAAQEQKIIAFGLVKYNSAKETKAWLESFGFDCSRGSGKEVYLDPVNVAARPAEMACLAEMKRLEALRRKFVSMENLFVEA